MSYANFGGKGKPYVKSPVGVTPNLQVGNWIVVPGQKKKSRLAGYQQNGEAILVPPRGKDRLSRVSMDAFRMAVGRNRLDVFGITRVNTANLTTLEELLANFV